MKKNTSFFVFSKILEEPSENQSEEQPYVPVQLPEQQNNRQNLMNIQMIFLKKVNIIL